jgi:2-iminobutanoate/2-iminopropanoate deaminase
MEHVKTDKAPLPLACYSQAVKAGGFLFVSGQVPLNPRTGKPVEGGIEAQTRQTLENLKAIVEAAGSSLEKTVKVTIFLKSMGDFKKMNDVYCTYFRKNPPARSAVQAQLAMPELLIEIDAITCLSQRGADTDTVGKSR